MNLNRHHFQQPKKNHSANYQVFKNTILIIIILFNVFTEYDSNNLLIRQAYNEVMEQQMEELRLRQMLERIQNSKIILTFPKQLTPFCFPIKVDSIRENMSSEKLEDRIKKMKAQLER